MLAGNMPATAGRMRALPDNMRSEYPSQLGNRFARAEREHVARSSRHAVGLHDPLALTAIYVNVRCARQCMTALRIGTKRRALRVAGFLESVWPVALRFWQANPV